MESSSFNIMKDKKEILIFMLILLFIISGCGKEDTQKAVEELRIGTEGVSVTFLPNNPPSIVYADQQKFDVVLEINNKGAYPQVEDPINSLGKVFLGGYDSNILTVSPNSFELNPIELQGKSMVNLKGGSTLITFKDVGINDLNVEKYEPTFLAVACYNYYTVAAPNVCIDPDPYSTISQKKVCQVQNIALTSQGAPIAVTKIEEEAFADKTQFKITIKNVGLGDVLKSQSGSGTGASSNVIDKCNPFGQSKIGREDIDKVYLQEVKIGPQTLQCWPFAGEKLNSGATENVKGNFGYIRLLNGEGSIICELTKSDPSYSEAKTAYTTPLRIVLTYAYKTTAERKIMIKKQITTTT